MHDEQEGRAGSAALGKEFSASEPTPNIPSLTARIQRTFLDFVATVDAAGRFYIDQDKASGTPKSDFMVDLVMATQESRLEFTTLESLVTWVREQGIEMREHGQRMLAKIRHAQRLWRIWRGANG
jgi:hypothetical protein